VSNVLLAAKTQSIMINVAAIGNAMRMKRNTDLYGGGELVGEKEADAGAVSVRSKGRGDLGVMTVEKFAEFLNEEVKLRTL